MPTVPILGLGILRKEEEVDAALVLRLEDLEQSFPCNLLRHSLDKEEGLFGSLGEQGRQLHGWRSWRHCVQHVWIPHGWRWRHHEVRRGGLTRCRWGGSSLATLFFLVGRFLSQGFFEGHLLPLVVQEKWLPRFMFRQFFNEFLHTQILHVLVSALHPCVAHLHNLVAVKAWQHLGAFGSVPLTHELGSHLWLAEVDEGVADVALAVEIDGQVDKVVLSFILLVQLLHEQVPGVSVGNVPQHHSGRLRGHLHLHLVELHLVHHAEVLDPLHVSLGGVRVAGSHCLSLSRLSIIEARSRAFLQGLLLLC
mmetsp:Transcript_1883/g.4340  ORF Transcript_1883/g.4340 Transcript_1883/m.4340 type:complete len:308 (+) Transcript_1883:1515-2438(+)